MNSELMEEVSVYLWARDRNLWKHAAFPIWLEVRAHDFFSKETDPFIAKNGHCCPIAVVACYSGSSQDDHNVRRVPRNNLSTYQQITVVGGHDR